MYMSDDTMYIRTGNDRSTAAYAFVGFLHIVACKELEDWEITR